jgi:hypothetical protein
MDGVVVAPDVYVAAVSHAEAHLSAIFEHVLSGGTGLIFDGRQPAARHVFVTADPPPGQDDLQAEVDALDRAHRARVSQARRARASMNGAGS